MTWTTVDGRVMSDEGSLKCMAKEVRAWCERKGWRQSEDYSVPDALGRTFGDEIALMHSELSEALEAYRDHGIEKWYEYSNTSGQAHRLGTVDMAEIESSPDRHQAMLALGYSAKPCGVGSELADELIRLLDTAEHLRINLFAEYREKMDYNETRAFRHGGRAL